MTDFREELKELLKKYAYKKGEYTLSFGKKTNYYINCKPVTLSGRGLTLASLLLLKDIDTQYVEKNLGELIKSQDLSKFIL